jgi:hypothetical protein
MNSARAGAAIAPHREASSASLQSMSVVVPGVDIRAKP